jgi:5-methylcytosine-specific restriction enzyme subunit McrC
VNAIHRTLREWERRPIGENGDAIPRWAADRLIDAAQKARFNEANPALIDRHRWLCAQQIVGVIAADGVTLEILPKTDYSDNQEDHARRILVHMLAEVLDFDIRDAGLATLNWQKHDLLEVLIRLFCGFLANAVRTGLLRRYTAQEEDLNRLRGRLDVRRQFTVLAGTPRKLACRFDELTPDIPLNQIVRAALLRLRTIARSHENQRLLRTLSLDFAEVSTVPVHPLPWEKVVLDRLSGPWRTILRMAQLLLRQQYQSTTAAKSDGFALLFDMDLLFEKYIGVLIRRGLNEAG